MSRAFVKEDVDPAEAKRMEAIGFRIAAGRGKSHYGERRGEVAS
jgi:hypothetical protein